MKRLAATLALLCMAAPAQAADAPECVGEALTAEQAETLGQTILARSINLAGVEAALLLLVPQAAICGQRHGWSADAAQASGEIAIYRLTMRLMAQSPSMGPERTERLEQWLTAQDPVAVRNLSNSTMQGQERIDMLNRLQRETGLELSRPMVTYIIARERLAQRLEIFPQL